MRRCVSMIVASITVACAGSHAPVGPSANPHGVAEPQNIGVSPAVDLPRVPLGAVRLYGRVIDFPASTPVPAATISLVDTPTARTQTDATGSYETWALPGVHAVYINGENVDSIGFKSDYHADFFLHLGNCTGFYGTVLDARSGQPVSGASIAFGGGGYYAQDVTGPQGGYVLRLECPARCSGAAGDAFSKGCSGSTAFVISRSGYKDYFTLWSRAEWGLTYFRRLDWTIQPQ